MSNIAMRDVEVVLDERVLLDDVTFDVASREWLFVLGPNGAGKTTLLRALAGLVLPARGSITLEGNAMHTLVPRERAKRVALVPQTPLIPPGILVLDYVLLGRTPHLGMFGSIARSDVDVAVEALETLELHEFAARRVESLSGGERQRVIIARALAQETPTLLLDEPTTSLDIGHQQDVLELVDSLRRARNLTVVTTMHDLTLAGQYADQMLLLRGGRIVEHGTPGSVMTAENLAHYYGARVDVIDGPHGRVVVPYRNASRLEEVL
jgi:iron complex transport system ATP-binding protein